MGIVRNFLSSILEIRFSPHPLPSSGAHEAIFDDGGAVGLLRSVPGESEAPVGGDGGEPKVGGRIGSAGSGGGLEGIAPGAMARPIVRANAKDEKSTGQQSSDLAVGLRTAIHGLGVAYRYLVFGDRRAARR